MCSQNRLAVVLCLLSFFLSFPLSAQETPEPAKVPSLNDAKTLADVMSYVQAEMQKHNPDEHDDKTNANVFAKIMIPAGDKILAIAKTPRERTQGYSLKLSAYRYQQAYGVEGAEEKLNAYVDEISNEPDAEKLVASHRFFQFRQKSIKAEPSAENYAKFMTELNTWIGKKVFPVTDMAQVGLEVAGRHNVPAEQFINDLTAYIRSPQCTALSTEEKGKTVVQLEVMIRLALGSDPKLYGKTLDNKDFDWKTLRGKYVLIKFTATWCGPCKMEVPGMLDAYKKYHDKGLEIVSVYVFQREEDPVATVKEFVAEEKLPWIILSEELTGKANRPKQGEYYGVMGVPTMILVDKEGKIIMTEARGNKLQAKLAEIFK